MKTIVVVLAVFGLVAVACTAPPTGQPAAEQSLPEVTVFRSPT